MLAGRKRYNHKRNHLKRLRVFCAVAKCESITDSSESLGLTQSAVSFQIRELERELNTLLFDHQGPRISLNAAGKRLFEQAFPIVQEMDSISVILADKLQQRMSESIRIGVARCGSFLVSPCLQYFRSEFPNIQLQVHNPTLSQAMNLLLSDSVEFVAGPCNSLKSQFPFHSLFSYKIAVVVPRNHPLSCRDHVNLDDLANFPFIAPSPELCNEHLFVDATLQKIHAVNNSINVVNHWGVIKSLVMQGLGISLLPDYCLVSRDPIHAVALSEDTKDRKFGIFIRNVRKISPLGRQLIKMLAKLANSQVERISVINAR